MKLTILGKHGPYPKAGGACSGYLLEADGKRILLDCGSGVLSRLQASCPIEALDAIVLTHLHSDHMADMLILRYALQMLTAKGIVRGRLPVYLPATPKAVADEIATNGGFDAHIVAGGDAVQIGDVSLNFSHVRHLVECNAVKVVAEGKTFLFTGDMNTTPGFEDFARGVDFLLIDANFFHAEWSEGAPHLSAKLAAELAQRAGVKRLMLTHIAPLCDEAALLAEARQAYPAAELAQEQAQVEI